MVLLILLLLLSCSWAFGFAMTHAVSMWYPVLYTSVILLGMAAPALVEFVSIRRS